MNLKYEMTPTLLVDSFRLCMDQILNYPLFIIILVLYTFLTRNLFMILVLIVILLLYIIVKIEFNNNSKKNFSEAFINKTKLDTPIEK